MHNTKDWAAIGPEYYDRKMKKNHEKKQSVELDKLRAAEVRGF